MSVEAQVQESETGGPRELSSFASGRAGSFRDAAIDFAKGALVLFMILYHWLNYFIGAQGHYYIYLRFLTPSFIFISGYMISRIQLGRYGGGGRSLSNRLMIRGLKLLALVLLLNVAVSLTRVHFQIRSAALAPALGNIGRAFIVANPTASAGEKSVSFSMLIPIAYLLILSAILVFFATRLRIAFLCTLSILTALRALSYSYGMVSSYLDLLLIGVLGVAIGFSSEEHISHVLKHTHVLIVLYCSYLAIITLWRVTLPLQVAGVILSVALLYMAGSRTHSGVAWTRTVLLGKYSLLGYVSQIAILQGLRKISWLSQRGVGAFVAFFLGILLTLIVVEVADFARKRSRVADGLYRLVFG